MELAQAVGLVGQEELTTEAQSHRERHEVISSVFLCGSVPLWLISSLHARHRLKPSSRAARSRSLPMKMSLFTRFASPHGLPGVPSSVMWTPWNTNRFGSPLRLRTPLNRYRSGPRVAIRSANHSFTLFAFRSPSISIPTDLMLSS